MSSLHNELYGTTVTERSGAVVRLRFESLNLITMLKNISQSQSPVGNPDFSLNCILFLNTITLY